MNCMAKTKFSGRRPRAAQNVEALLHHMKKQFECGASNVRPNVYCYNSAIDAWARASNPNKAEEIFLEMCEDYKNGNETAKPQTVTFNSTCSFERCVGTQLNLLIILILSQFPSTQS
jgi:pentatricopeptide repeat protein